jgi:mono/diheme cytochrome c family protein
MTTQRTVALSLALLLAGTLAACSKSEGGAETTQKEPAKKTQAEPPKPAAKMDMAAAKEMYGTRCAACHGPEGKGDGAGAAALNPKPRNYHDKEWQKTVTDEQIRKTILMGGAAVGKSPIMPASPDLDSKPEVVEGLVQVVRDFGK